MTPLESARWAHDNGYSPIQVPLGEKGPHTNGWQNTRIEAAELAAYFGGECNIGLLCGEPSQGLVDLDLDCAEALAVAQTLLPQTGLRHGRAGAPNSHWWYRVQPASVATKKYLDVDGSVLLEIRSTGAQTLIPPSKHPDGDSYTWDEKGSPALVSKDILERAVGKAAAAALLIRHYPANGCRHDFSLALAGAILRRGMSLGHAKELIRLVAQTAGDEEAARRINNVLTTEERLAKDLPATGWPTVIEVVGQKVADKVEAWLGLKPENAASMHDRQPRVWTPQELAEHDFGLQQFYVEPIVAPQSDTLLFGTSESGKTQLIFTMFRDVQEEGLFLSEFECTRTAMVLVEVDMGELATQRRVKDILRRVNLDPKLIRIVTVPMSLNVLEASADDEWVQRCHEIYPGIVVFDSLRKIHPLDENDPSAPSRVYGKCRELFPEAARIYNHHTRKEPAPYIKGRTSQADDRGAYRGTTAWKDDAAQALHAHYDSRKGTRALLVEKARLAPDTVKNRPLAYAFNPETKLVGRTDPTPEMLLKVWASDQEKVPKKKDAKAWLEVRFPHLGRSTHYRIIERTDVDFGD